MNELLIENLLLLLVLCLVAVAYLRMADKLNIIDKPNQRSSHTRITVRGGGVIFPVSLLLYSIVHGFPYLYFIAGLTLIAVISFADDLKHQSRKLRLAVHFAAVSLLLFQVNEMSLPYWLLPILFVLSIGVINAYNFMDGINGITKRVCYHHVADPYFLTSGGFVYRCTIPVCFTYRSIGICIHELS
ncbi:hypothetical protein [Phnomibacter ginsenosidimutans]|uniref:UDP-GlcNAc--UDP-phosphate GlcNAc-1-phosphate transferase n=1 Tax=Phnomibacter ginsenosidimutans TaxID=2676868 RepID=A0A6I6G8W4_9BACT|nr:hypothetical protein [Phnomibacter ginsenosidimutans]QGW28754.1 hypothetical protein GLV81_12170 [Phnomibacter ginsenosidimutans]